MKSLITVILCLLSVPIASCIGDGECDCSGNEVKNLKEVSFKGFIYPDKSVKSSATIPSGIRAVVIAYQSGDNPVSKSCYPATPLSVVSDQNGNLLIESENPLLMPVGNYDFYAFSSNSGNKEGFELKAGKLSGLTNGKDYLWAAKKETSVNSSTYVTFDFIHKCTAIVLNFFAGNGVDSLFVTNVLAAKSSDTGELLLSSGEITPSRTLSTIMEKVAVFENTCQWIMIPLSGIAELPLIIDAVVKIGKSTEYKRFKTSLQIENNKFMAGTLYKYMIIIDTESITLGNTVISEWAGICLENIYARE
ncbi:MAG: fimbrillin family protein [Bacteroidales bacterium]|nr:fimbrillin family protein [Bacteroidales bacterium]